MSLYSGYLELSTLSVSAVCTNSSNCSVGFIIHWWITISSWETHYSSPPCFECKHWKWNRENMIDSAPQNLLIHTHGRKWKFMIPFSWARCENRSWQLNTFNHRWSVLQFKQKRSTCAKLLGLVYTFALTYGWTCHLERNYKVVIRLLTNRPVVVLYSCRVNWVASFWRLHQSLDFRLGT